MELKETFSEHFGLRLTPKMAQRLISAAKKNNMPPAVFVRWIVFNYLDALKQ